MSEVLNKKMDTNRNSHSCLVWFGIFVIAMLVAGVLLYSIRGPILRRVGGYLVNTDATLNRADVIFVLNGDYNTRPFYAADLYDQRKAPRVAIAQSESSPAVEMGLVENVTDIAVRIMESEGVPADDLYVLSENHPVTSTFDEAAALKQYMIDRNYDSLILVTSQMHTRRARWIFEKELAGLDINMQVAGAPHAHFDASNWWTVEDGLIFVNNEYIKLYFYWIKYR
jgi:uncharacterized SAM-binding protein YcdF (DUF218 family)